MSIEFAISTAECPTPPFWHVLKIYASILTPDPPTPRIPLDGILFTVRNASFSGDVEEYVKIETKDLRSGVYCVD